MSIRDNSYAHCMPLHWRIQIRVHVTAVLLCVALCLGLAVTRGHAQEANVTQAQKTVVIKALQDAVRQGSPLPLEPLLHTAGMSAEDRAWNHRAMGLMVRSLGRDPGDLRFQWRAPAAQDDVHTQRAVASCTATIVLQVSLASIPGNRSRLPMCLVGSELLRVGTIRTPMP